MSQTMTSHNDSEAHPDGVHVISWNLDYVAEPLLVSLFIFAAGALKLGFHYASFLSSIIPESCLLIVTGTIFGAVLKAAGLVERFTMGPRLFMLFLLPPIVLDSAYSLHDRVFFEHLGTILVYAVIGTILNFAMLGPTLYGLASAGAMGGLDITLVECLLFSSFIVAVDPVAVLAIFQEVGVNNILYFLVFGESLLNDAVTVVLSNMMKAFVDMETIPPNQVLLGVASFFTVSLGGLLIGLMYGIFTAVFTKYTAHVRVVEPLAVLTFAYMSYLTAELVHWSGIIAMIGCGLVQAEYSFHNVSRKSHITVKYFIKMLSCANDCIIFLFLGIELVTTKYEWHTGFVLWSVFYCLVFRFVVVFGLTFIMNRCNHISSINFEEQFIMWYGGLRGAVCFALCDTIRENFRHKDLFLTTTFFIILFTVFLQGSTIKPLVSLCHIRRKGDESLLLIDELNSKVTDHMMTGIEAIVEYKGSNYFRTWLIWFNDNRLRLWLQKDPINDDEKLLTCYGEIVMKDYEDVINKTYLHPVLEEKSKFYLTPPSYIRPGEGRGLRINAALEHTTEPETQSPILRHRQLRTVSQRDSVTVAINDAVRGRTSVNLEDPTAADIKALLRHGDLSSTVMHQKYDKNLIYDDEHDIERHLEEKHRRLARMRRMALRTYSLSDAESPNRPRRRHLQSESATAVTELEVTPKRHLSSNDTAGESVLVEKHKTTAQNETFDLIRREKPKPKPRLYLHKGNKGKEKDGGKTQQMILLHEQGAVKSDSELSD